MKEINEAYDILGDPTKRACYDRERALHNAEERRKRQAAEAALRWAREEADALRDKLEKERQRGAAA